MCGFGSAPEAQFCRQCGQPLGGHACPHCGHGGLDPTDKTCRSCGKPVDRMVTSRETRGQSFPMPAADAVRSWMPSAPSHGESADSEDASHRRRAARPRDAAPSEAGVRNAAPSAPTPPAPSRAAKAASRRHTRRSRRKIAAGLGLALIAAAGVAAGWRLVPAARHGLLMTPPQAVDRRMLPAGPTPGPPKDAPPPASPGAPPAASPAPAPAPTAGRTARTQRARGDQAAIARGKVLYNSGKYEAAAEAFAEASRISPRSAAAHLWSGMALVKLGQDASAAESFRRVLDLAPRSREATAAKRQLAALRARVPVPQAPPAPLEVGARAPDFSLKDRVGVLHRAKDVAGRRLVLLFVWTLDTQARQLIRDLNERLPMSGDGPTAMAVVLRPDRVAIRSFVSAETIGLPVLLGSGNVARVYGVPSGSPVLYLVSAQGEVAQRQVGTIRFASIVP